MSRKRSYECVLKAGTRTIKFRNDDVSDQYKDPHTWAQKVLGGCQGIFGDYWQLVRTTDRKVNR